MNPTIKEIFYTNTKLPLEIIKIILLYVKCCLCNNMAHSSCIYCDECFCNRCYSPFYGMCVCYKCSNLLF